MAWAAGEAATLGEAGVDRARRERPEGWGRVPTDYCTERHAFALVLVFLANQLVLEVL